MQTPSGARGIGLLEACIVIAIIGIVAAGAVPSMQGLLDGRRLAGAATQLAADIQLTRSEAVLRNRSLRLSLHTLADASCYLIHTGAASQCTCRTTGPATCSGAAQPIKSVVWPAADRVVLQGNVASILFDPVHGTSTPTGTLRVIGTQGRAVHHIVNIMGRVRSCAPTGRPAGYPVC